MLNGNGRIKSLTKTPSSTPFAMEDNLPYDLDWELRLNFLVHDVARLRRRVVDRALKPLGLTRAQWLLLVFLARSDGLSQVALAEQMDIGKVAVGGLIDRLENAGLIERRSDKIDRRIKRLFITATGKSTIATIRKHVSGEETRILHNLDSADLETTVRTLRGMKANLAVMLATDDI